MSFHAEDLLTRLEAFEPRAGSAVRFVVAMSGGLDSSVLLHALVETQARHGRSLLAVHVDHGLHPASAEWAAHCRRTAAELGVELIVETVEVDLTAGRGPEAAAREARYAAIAPQVVDGDWLLSAHHQDDQAETLLINLLRGSGPAGIAGIPSLRRFGAGWLVRPLLDVPRADLEAYADTHGLEWRDDPSNDDPRFDRNFLRAQVVPVLGSRWPDVAARLAASAGYAREAAGLLAELGDIDIAALGGDPAVLDVDALKALSPPRQRNALRRALTRAGLPQAPAAQLNAVLEELLTARQDASPLVRWPGAEVRRFDGRVYLLEPLAPPEFDGRRLGREPVALGAGLGRLALVAADGTGLDEAHVASGLTLRRRSGGEQIKPLGHAHTRKLKKLLHDAGIVPWMRDRLPLVYSGERLVAVADLWLDAEAAAPGGLAVEWRERPPLY